MNNRTEVNVTHIPNVTDAPPQPVGGIPTDIKIGMTLAYAVIFLIGLFGNSFGLFIVLKKSSSTSATNLFIANMAVADLLLTLTVMPYSAAYMYRTTVWFGGTFGVITCKAVFYIIPVSISATVFTMMFISVDRFYAIFFPLKEKFFRKPKILSAIIWLLSVLLMIPYPFLFQVGYFSAENAYHCYQAWPWADPNDLTYEETYHVLESFHISVFVIMYALPLFITISIYFLICRKLWLRKIPGNVTDNNRAAAEKSKRKVVRLLVIICVVFAVCWFPVYVNLYFWFVVRRPEDQLPLAVQFVFNWLAHANSAINPCLYILLNGKFRKEFCALLACCPDTSSAQIPPQPVAFFVHGKQLQSDQQEIQHVQLMSVDRNPVSVSRSLPNPKEGEIGHINLALSRMSVKDDVCSPPVAPTESAQNNAPSTSADSNKDINK